MIGGLFAARFALQAVGMFNQYQQEKELADIQADIYEIQKQEAEFQAKIQERQVRAEQRTMQASQLVRDTSRNAQRSTTSYSQIRAIGSAADYQVQNIQQLSQYQQDIYQRQADLVQERAPSVLDMALGIVGAGIETGADYLKATYTPKPQTQAPLTNMEDYLGVNLNDTSALNEYLYGE